MHSEIKNMSVCCAGFIYSHLQTSEGVENLEHNYTTFAVCQQAFEQGAIVLIFSEGGVLMNGICDH